MSIFYAVSQDIRFSQQLFQKILLSSGNITKSSIFSGNIKNFAFQAKISHLQQLVGKLLYFSSKAKVIRYNNISRPPCPKSGGRDPNSLGLTPLSDPTPQPSWRRWLMPVADPYGGDRPPYGVEILFFTVVFWQKLNNYPLYIDKKQ